MLREGVVLSVNNISKKYYTKQSHGLQSEKDAFWALKNISFELRKGEILGIIGQNGAGKSTILKILSDIIPPSEGSVEYTGSILSILDIGTGFHPDLSGYENIFLNASILGVKNEHTIRKAQEIIGFSGIENFIHEPVKSYSSGMYLRLALSIALFTDSEIILLDEVISVGDAEFRLKAIQKIREHTLEGRACIMISHDLNSITELCESCLLLEKGKIIFSGKSKAVVREYYDSIYSRILAKRKQILEHPTCKIEGVYTEREDYCMNEPIGIRVVFELYKQEDIRVVMKVRNHQAVVVTDSAAYRPEFVKKVLTPGRYEVVCNIPADLFNSGNYFVDILLSNDEVLFVNYAFAAKFGVYLDEWERGSVWNLSNDAIPIRPICKWSMDLLA